VRDFAQKKNSGTKQARHPGVGASGLEGLPKSLVEDRRGGTKAKKHILGGIGLSKRLTRGEKKTRNTKLNR